MDSQPVNQLDLFRPFPRAKPKVFRGANGFELPYWHLQRNRVPVELHDGVVITITRESAGRSGNPRLYTKIPGRDGIIQARNLKTILAQIALSDQIRALNKSVQIKLKQQDDAARALSDLTKDNDTATQEEKARLDSELELATRLRDELKAENTRLRAEVAKRSPVRTGQWSNSRAIVWAYDQEDLSLTCKAVLITFAKCANDHGYTWPGVDLIASTWRMDPRTVRQAIKSLLLVRLIRPTKKRTGSTGQVKVYRLPKITYERGGKMHPFGNDESGGKAGHKQGERLAKFPPNNGIMEPQHQADGDSSILGTKVAPAPSNASPSSSVNFVEGHQHQSQSARDHIKWPEYAAYCGTQNGKPGKNGRVHDGIPTEKGFWKWLCGQKPQWRNKRKEPDYIEGFALDGKFLTPEKANQIAADNPKLLDAGKFCPAIKRGNKIEIKR